MMSLFSKHLNIRFSLFYFCIASLWIVISDTLLVAFANHYPETDEVLHTSKGLLFVVVTTVMLYVVLSAATRKRMQIEIELQKERDISPIGIAVLAPTGAIRYANTQAEKILGLTRSAIIQQTYNAPDWRITDYDGNPFPDEALPFAQVIRTRQTVYGVQHAIQWADGRRVFLEINAAPLFANDGSIHEVVATFNDVTQLHQNARLLRESEATYRLLFRNNPLPMWLYDFETLAFLEVNDAAIDKYGYSQEEFLRLNLRDIRPPEDVPRLNTDLTQPRPELQHSGEWRHRLKNGKVIDVEITSHTLEYTGRRAVLVLAQDVSERQQAEKALRASEERLRLFIEHAPVAIAMLDRELRYLAVSRRWITDYRLNRTDLIGQSHYEIFPEIPERWRAAHVRALMGAVETAEEDEFERQAGSVQWLRWAIHPWFSADGTIGGIGIFTEDITERKEGQQALQRYNQRLTILRQIDGDIINALPLESLTENLLTHVRALITCDRTSVTLFEDVKNEAVIFALAGDDPMLFHAQMRVPLIRNANVEVLESGQILVIADLHMIEGSLSEFALKAKQEGIRATLSAPIRIDGKLIGHLNLASKTPNYFSAEHVEIAREISDQLAMAFRNAHLLQHIQTTNQQLQVLSARLVEAQETERRHIARELHDEIGQTLTALSLMLDMQARHSGDQNHSVDLSVAQTLVSELTKRIRELSLDLRPSMLDDLGLIPALIWYFRRYEQQTEIAIDFKYNDAERRFAPTIETTVYRIIQEALTNIARYAQTDQASVRMWTTLESLHVQIADEGIGFDVNAAQSANRTSGILGMRERAQIVGGECTLQSAVGAGTVVSVSLPLQLEN